MVKLDDFDELKSVAKRIRAIKIDVENYEYYVLKGSENIIKKHKPIIYCELWDNKNREKCIDFLNKLGYSAFLLNKTELVPFETAKFKKQNFFFVNNSIT
jgi:hypothetical protein